MERKTEESWSRLLMQIFVPILVAAAGMYTFGYSGPSSQLVQVKEMNGDGRPYVVVYNRSRFDKLFNQPYTDKAVYLQREDGTYQTLEQIQKNEREAIESNLEHESGSQ